MSGKWREVDGNTDSDRDGDSDSDSDVDRDYLVSHLFLLLSRLQAFRLVT